MSKREDRYQSLFKQNVAHRPEFLAWLGKYVARPKLAYSVTIKLDATKPATMVVRSFEPNEDGRPHLGSDGRLVRRTETLPIHDLPFVTTEGES